MDMNCVERAMCYIRRKSTKSVLLLFIFLVANCTILGTLSILDTSALINDEIRKQTNSKVTVESIETDHGIIEQDVQEILNFANVNSVNRVTNSIVYASHFVPVAGSDENVEGKVWLHGFDDLEKDSPFAENVCRIVEGNFARKDNEVVINQYLAEYNQIEIGDTISFFLESGETLNATVTGFYLTGNERQQTENVYSINRIENQIYSSISLIQRFDEGKYEKIVAYVDNPELLSDTAERIEDCFGDSVVIRTQDTMYQKMKFVVAQIERVTKLIFALTVITSIFVVGMLLCMWMRNRKVEMAIFISMGISKSEVFLQMVVEIVFLYSLGCFLSAGIFAVLAPMLSTLMGKVDGLILDIRFSMLNVLKIWILGMGILSVITFIALLPNLKKKIKDTLSEMEG